MRGASYLLFFLMARCAPPSPSHESSYKRDSLFFNNATQNSSLMVPRFGDFDFGVGESYAGLVLLPLPSNFNGTRQVVSWFFPSTSPSAMDKIVI